MHKMKTPGTSELVLGLDYEAGNAYFAAYLRLIVSKYPWSSGLLLELDPNTSCLAAVWLGGGGVTIHLAAETIRALDEAESLLRERFPVRMPTEDQTVPVTFWSYGPRGPAETSRSIAVPTWPDIRGNYPARVANELEPLMDPAYRPDGRGQLILWYGQPGTGKTYSLRSLGWQWRTWCEFHYVTDPEVFFGRSDTCCG